LWSAGTYTPHLITLGDQKLTRITFFQRLILRPLLGSADQVYAMDAFEARSAISLGKRTGLIRSIGQGDALANQMRIAYAHYLKEQVAKAR
jgi:hypothetical protein